MINKFLFYPTKFIPKRPFIYELEILWKLLLISLFQLLIIQIYKFTLMVILINIEVKILFFYSNSSFKQGSANI